MPRIHIRELVWVARLTGDDLRDLCNDFLIKSSLCWPFNAKRRPVDVTKGVELLWDEFNSIIS